MKSKYINIVNYKEAELEGQVDLTDVMNRDLQKASDHDLALIRLKPNQAQKNHYHTFADLDIFTIVEGYGNLHLAKIEDDRIVPGSEEVILVKAGDTYAMRTYVLHGITAGKEGLTYLNIAHATHGLPEEGETHRRAVDVFFPLE